MVFPWIPFLQKRGGKKLSDIEFLAIKDYGTDGTDSKRVDADGAVTIVNSTAANDVVSVTANTGKDMYLGGASWSARQTAGSSAMALLGNLVVDGTTVETVTMTHFGNTEAEIKFTTKGIKVAAGEIIKITGVNSRYIV